MEALVDDWPVWLVFAVLWAGAFARGDRHLLGGPRCPRRRQSLVGGPATSTAVVVRRAEGWVTCQCRARPAGDPRLRSRVGVQTAINASAGMLRMPQRRFLATPSCLGAALLVRCVYTTVGFTVLDAWLGDLSWWWARGGRRGVVVAIVLVSRRLERQGPRGRSAPSTPSHPYPRSEAVITWWAPASTCWHLPMMETRPSGVPEVLRQRVGEGPCPPGHRHPADRLDDRPQQHRR